MSERSDLKIVVADDNKDAAMAMTMLLDRLGFDVVATAYDGTSAVACIERERPHQRVEVVRGRLGGWTRCAAAHRRRTSARGRVGHGDA